MKHTRILLWAAAIALLLSSCYKIVSTFAPEEVAPGETFEVCFTVIDDGSATQNFVTDWSYAGIRVPKGWTVTVPKGAHQQFAEDWVYYSDGSKVSSQHDMQPCPKLSEFYGKACPRTGYEWAGFQSVTKIPKNISACWRNGADSVRVTFLVTVPENAKPGRYAIDFMGGDEEDEAGIDKYGSYTDAKGTRLYHVGTATGAYVDNTAPQLSRTVVVLDPDGIGQVSASKPADGQAYGLDGKPAAQSHGHDIIIRNGQKILRK